MGSKLIEIFFNTDIIILTVSIFLSIDDVYILAMMSDKLMSTVNNSFLLSKLMIREVINKTYALTKMNKSSLTCIEQIINNNANICCRGTIHPFRTDERYTVPCYQLSSITHIFEDRKLRLLSKQGYYMYQLFKLPVFNRYTHIFRHNAICHYVQLYIPFANNGVSDNYLYNYTINDFKNVIGTINITSSTLSNLHSKLWQAISIKFIYNRPDIGPFIPLNIRYDPEQIIKCFNSLYHFAIWRNYINWKHFYIAGDAVTFALILNDNLMCNPGIDFFSYQLTYEQYCDEIMQLLTKLTKDNMYYQTSSINDGTIVIYISTKGRQTTPIRLRFIYTCKYASIMNILSRFDLGSVQVGIRPELKTLFCTASFIYFLKTSKCLVYNLDEKNGSGKLLSGKLERIINHKKNGITNFELPRAIDIEFFRWILVHVPHIDHNKFPYHVTQNNTKVVHECSLISSFSEHIQPYNLSKNCSVNNHNNNDLNGIFTEFINQLYIAINKT